MKQICFLTVMSLCILSVTCCYGSRKKHAILGDREDNTSSVEEQVVGDIHWYTDYQEAGAAAVKDKKPMLLFFTGSDWCGWCKKMTQEIFSVQDFKDAAGNKFIFVEVDLPMKKSLSPAQTAQNADLKKKYDVTGYPAVVVTDSNGTKLFETGYRPGGGKAFAQYLDSQLSTGKSQSKAKDNGKVSHSWAK